MPPSVQGGNWRGGGSRGPDPPPPPQPYIFLLKFMFLYLKRKKVFDPTDIFFSVKALLV